MTLIAGTDAILKEREATARAMTQGFPKTGAKLIEKQLRRMIRVAFHLGMVAALTKPAEAEQWYEESNRNPNNFLKDDQP